MPGPSTATAELSPQTDVLQAVTFYMGLALLFVKFSLLQEVLGYLLQSNTYVLYVFAVPAFLGVLVSGGIGRTMQARVAKIWLAYAIWLLLDIPFSTWKAGSLQVTVNFWRTNLPMLFIAAGLVISWRECQLFLKMIAAASLLNLLSARIFANTTENGRFELEFGSVSNSNDFAGHLLLVLPFLFLVIQNSKSNLLRVILIPAGLFGLLTILRTGSRGAGLALAACFLFILLRGTASQRTVLVIGLPLALIAALPLVNRGALVRFGVVSEGATETAMQAQAEQLEVGATEESTEARRYVLRKALEYAIEFPLFGVGAGQFINYEGSHNKIIGTHGSYHNVHNSFLAPFTETGIPGGLLYLWVYIASFLLLNNTYRGARHRSDCRDIRNATFYCMLAIVGFGVSILFLNFTNSWYGPAIGGIAIAVARAGNHELARRQPAAA